MTRFPAYALACLAFLLLLGFGPTQTVEAVPAAEPGLPVALSGVANPQAQSPAGPIRFEPPERQWIDFQGMVDPWRTVGDARSVGIRANRSSGSSSPSPALHLRHCVFLC